MRSLNIFLRGHRRVLYYYSEGELAAQTFHWSVIHGSEPCRNWQRSCNKAFMVRYCNSRSARARLRNKQNFMRYYFFPLLTEGADDWLNSKFTWCPTSKPFITITQCLSWSYFSCFDLEAKVLFVLIMYIWNATLLLELVLYIHICLY